MNSCQCCFLGFMVCVVPLKYIQCGHYLMHFLLLSPFSTEAARRRFLFFGGGRQTQSGQDPLGSEFVLQLFSPWLDALVSIETSATAIIHIASKYWISIFKQYYGGVIACLYDSGWSSCSISLTIFMKQGRIHGYPSRVRVGRGHIWGHLVIWAGAVRPKSAKTHKK